MHARTYVKDEMRAKADEIAGKHLDEYQAGMIEHDMHIGQFLDLLDEQGIADNTMHFGLNPVIRCTKHQGLLCGRICRLIRVRVQFDRLLPVSNDTVFLN